MKDINLFVWITQLGLGVAAPAAGFTLAGVWLKNRYGLGAWIVIVLCAVGLARGAVSFIRTLRMIEKKEKEADKKAIKGYNEHG